MDQARHLREIFQAALGSVQTSNLIQTSVKLKTSEESGKQTLTIVDRSFELKKPVYIIGFGKAVFAMASELLNVLGDKVERGILTIPAGTHEVSKMALGTKKEQLFAEKFEVFEGAYHNLPDEYAMKGAKKIYDLVESLDYDDVLIVLISGGGSALLPLPKEGVTLDEKILLTRELFNRGAGIFEVNCVRKKLSIFKGGGLARIAYPAKVYSLILSDVVGDSLDIIASGPTAPHVASQCMNVLSVLNKYELLDGLSRNLKTVVSHEETQETTASTLRVFRNVKNFVIGNNSLACTAAAQKAQKLGYYADVVTTRIDGKVPDVAEFYLEIVKYFKYKSRPIIAINRYQDLLDPMVMVAFEKMKYSRAGDPLCLIFGGEPTIVVGGKKGKGGRNMHLALELAMILEGDDSEGIYFLSCGTDGIDGPTDMAGAIAPVGLTPEEKEQAKPYLENCDTYNYFKEKKPDYLIRTGHTGTNVMDIHILIITGKAI